METTGLILLENPTPRPDGNGVLLDVPGLDEPAWAPEVESLNNRPIERYYFRFGRDGQVRTGDILGFIGDVPVASQPIDALANAPEESVRRQMHSKPAWLNAMGRTDAWS